MVRRDFLKKSALASGAALPMGGIRALASNKQGSNPATSNPGRDHPLYFDGMTFLSDDSADVAKSGLSGLILDVSSVETINGQFVRPFRACLKSITAARHSIGGDGSPLFLATRGSQIGKEKSGGKTAVFFQFQSMEPMAESLDDMDTFYELGLRICQITHHATNPFGGGSLVRDWKGLTKLGHQSVEKMNSLGVIPDLSHGNEIMSNDVLKASKKPVIITHTACRAIVNNARCAPDSVIKGVADSGGVVGIFSMSFWLTTDPVPTVDSYIRQLDHVIRVGGIEAVGISNDYTIAGLVEKPGVPIDNARAVQGYLPWWSARAKEGILGFDAPPQHCVIPELNNVRRFFTIQAALEKKGRRAVEIEKIIGGNWIRVLSESLG